VSSSNCKSGKKTSRSAMLSRESTLWTWSRTWETPWQPLNPLDTQLDSLESTSTMALWELVDSPLHSSHATKLTQQPRSEHSWNNQWKGDQVRISKPWIIIISTSKNESCEEIRI
jgi:hypothetical protein